MGLDGGASSLGGQPYEVMGRRLHHLVSAVLLLYVLFMLWGGGSQAQGARGWLLVRQDNQSSSSGGSGGHSMLGAGAAGAAGAEAAAGARRKGAAGAGAGAGGGAAAAGAAGAGPTLAGAGPLQSGVVTGKGEQQQLEAQCTAAGWSPPGGQPLGCPTCTCLEGQPCECPLECPSWQEVEAKLQEEEQQQPQQPQQQQQAGSPSTGCDKAGKYNLAHLNQRPDQRVVGPVQDDEALLLYAVVRGMRMQTVVEIGGLGGYSARNFLKAMDPTNGIVITADLNKVPQQHPARHVTIQKNVFDLTVADIGNRTVDLLFLDCHAVDAQMHLYHLLDREKLIDAYTVIALHDTNLHPKQYMGWAREIKGQGWLHRSAERILVQKLRALGWDAWSLHPPFRVHSPSFPYRHGLTLMQRYRPLTVL